MKRAYYDVKPSVLEATGNGGNIYRWDIKEEQVENTEGMEQSERAQYSCHEVVVWNPITEDKLKEAVISALGGDSKELKMLNERNSFLMGMSSVDNSEEYKSFLTERAKVKAEVHEVFNEWMGVKVSDEEVLAKAKASKIAEIYAYDSSDAVNRCYITYNGVTIPYWASKSERNDLKTALNDCIKAGVEVYRLDLRDVGISISAECEKLLTLLAELEVYAVKCFNKTTDHVFAVNGSSDADEVRAYDNKVGYPEIPTFVL